MAEVHLLTVKYIMSNNTTETKFHFFPSRYELEQKITEINKKHPMENVDFVIFDIKQEEDI